MSKNKEKYVDTELSLSSSLSDDNRKHYEYLHNKLPKMEKNQLNIQGVDINLDSSEEIIVSAFIRSTVEKPIKLKTMNIILLDNNLEIFAITEEDFIGLGTLFSNTCKIWNIKFKKDIINNYDKSRLKMWSIAFADNLKHRIDLSDMDEKKISDKTKDKLNKIAQSTSLDENELSFMGLSAKYNESKNLMITLLIQNGTKKNLEIKKIPLKFYDGSGELSAKGTFKFKKLVVFANTSKPITLVFPYSNILKSDLDLSNWSISHEE